MAAGSTSAAASLNEASDEIQGLIDGMVQIRDALAAAEPDSPVLAEFDRSIELQRSLKNRVDEMAQTLSGASGDIDGQRAEIADLVAQAKQSVSDVQWSYAAQLEDELAKLGNSLDDIASSSAGIADGLDGVAAGLSGVSGSLSGDLASAKAALEEAAEALGSSADKLDAARSSLRSAAESGDVEEIKRIVGSDVSTMAQFLAAPVREDRRAVYGIANNGSSMAAFYTILSLWVGSIILVAMMKVEVPERRIAALETPCPANAISAASASSPCWRSCRARSCAWATCCSSVSNASIRCCSCWQAGAVAFVFSYPRLHARRVVRRHRQSRCGRVAGHAGGRFGRHVPHRDDGAVLPGRLSVPPVHAWDCGHARLHRRHIRFGIRGADRAVAAVPRARLAAGPRAPQAGDPAERFVIEKLEETKIM